MHALKRGLDLAVAGVAMVLLLPLLGGIALAIRLTMGRPILFRQRRPGLHGRPFEILKFRTMLDLRDGQGRVLSDVQRLTRLGRLLRHSSLDELPALLNLLRGEMSLVGPRPLLMQYLDRYSPEQARRHDVLPASPAGPRSMGETPSPGRKSSNSTCGTSITGACGWTSASSG